MAVFSQEESDLLDRIAIDMELEKLAELDMAIVTLHFAYRIPDWFAGVWPPRRDEIGEYAGAHCTGGAVSGAMVGRCVRRILGRWGRRAKAGLV